MPLVSETINSFEYHTRAFWFTGVDGTASTQSDRFSIDLLTGEISVDTRTLDYEQAVSHTLCVNASTSKSDSSLNSDQWKVIVRVTDRDDNILQFLRATQSAGTFHLILKTKSINSIEVFQYVFPKQDFNNMLNANLMVIARS